MRDLRALVAALPPRARPDFFDAHHFTGGGELAEQVFSKLRDVAAPTPLWIGELGYPTSTTLSGLAGVPLTPSAQEAAQTHYFKLCFTALARLGLPAPGIWILDDFAPDAIPQSDVAGREPEHHFGLFREDGSAKPAAAAVRRLFAGRLETGFNGGFEAAAVAEDGPSVPAIWGSTGELRLVRDPTVARSGAASARVVGRTGGSGTFLVAPVTAAVQSGRADSSAWVRGTDAALRVAIVWFDPLGRQVGQQVDVGAGGADAGAELRSPPGRRRKPRSRGSFSARTGCKAPSGSTTSPSPGVRPTMTSALQLETSASKTSPGATPRSEG